MSFFVLLLEMHCAVRGIEHSMNFELADIILTLALDFVSMMANLKFLEVHGVLGAMLLIVSSPDTSLARFALRAHGCD